MIIIAATEFRKNMNKYLEMATNEDVYITKYGQRTYKLSAASGFYAMRGAFKTDKDVDSDKLLEEAILERCRMH